MPTREREAACAHHARNCVREAAGAQQYCGRAPCPPTARQPPPAPRGAARCCGRAGRAAAGGAVAAGLADADYEAARAQEQRRGGRQRRRRPTSRSALARDLQDAAGAALERPQRRNAWRARGRRAAAQPARAAAHRAARRRARASTDAVESPYQRAAVQRAHARRHRRRDRARLRRAAQRLAAPAFSRSYFVPQPGGLGLEVIDLCLPVQRAGRADGFLVATFALPRCSTTPPAPSCARRTSFRSSRATARGSRAPACRAAPACIVAERLVDLPGTRCAARRQRRRPPAPDPEPGDRRWCSGCRWRCSALVLLLARDVRRRATRRGARWPRRWPSARRWRTRSSPACARATCDGRITYVNPAFCAMVGFSADELLRDAPRRRTGRRSWSTSTRAASASAWPACRSAPRAGLRDACSCARAASASRCMIYEAPLVDGSGRHTGWMSAVLDVSAQRRVEELSRQQQERLQATARLATRRRDGVAAQPRAEPAAGGDRQLRHRLAEPAATTPDADDADAAAAGASSASPSRPSVPAASSRACTTSCAAASSARETVAASELVDAVLPLVRLQARKSGTRIDARPARAGAAGGRATARWSSRCCST